MTAAAGRRRTDLRALQRVLASEEELLAALIELGLAQQQALIQSAFDDLEPVNGQLIAVAGCLAALEDEREQILARLGAGHLSEAIALADTLGERDLVAARERLLEAARRFRDIQERNAGLILAASRLRERWVALLAGTVGGTYGAAGTSGSQQARQIVSKSA